MRNIEYKIGIMKIRKIISIFLNIFILYFSIMTLVKIFNPEKTAKYLGCDFFPVASGSMEPFIKTGELVFISGDGAWRPQHLKTARNDAASEPVTTTPKTKPKDEAMKHGDVVVFKNPNYDPNKEPGIPNPMFVIHRVVYNNSQKKLIGTWGDNNSTQLDLEQNIPYENIIGKYVFKDIHIFPKIKKLFYYFKEHPWHFVMIVVYCLIMILILCSIVKSQKNEN